MLLQDGKSGWGYSKMKRYKTPSAGDTVTVTTRYRSIFKYDDKEYDEYTYKDVTVLPSYDWMKREEFRIKDFEKMGHGIILTDRVISTNKVSKMSGDNVEIIEFDDADAGVRTVNIMSKRTGEIYNITIEDGIAIECTCKGFHFRHRCSHLAAAVKP